jgi:hypothetical protein
MVATPLDKSSSITLHVLLPFDICVPSQYIFVHSWLITRWLNLITHDPLCPSCNWQAQHSWTTGYVQGNWLKHACCCEKSQHSCTSTFHGKLCTLTSYLVQWTNFHPRRELKREYRSYRNYGLVIFLFYFYFFSSIFLSWAWLPSMGMWKVTIAYKVR